MLDSLPFLRFSLILERAIDGDKVVKEVRLAFFVKTVVAVSRTCAMIAMTEAVEVRAATLLCDLATLEVLEVWMALLNVVQYAFEGYLTGKVDVLEAEMAQRSSVAAQQSGQV